MKVRQYGPVQRPSKINSWVTRTGKTRKLYAVTPLSINTAEARQMELKTSRIAAYAAKCDVVAWPKPTGAQTAVDTYILA